MLLYMIRHGESEANRARKFAGWLPVPLSEKGREQARLAGEKLRGIRFDKIYASDLKRAMETCELALPGCEYETTPLLREYNVGSVGGKSPEECEAEYGEVYTQGIARLDMTPFGGEDHETHLRRVAEFFSQVGKSDAETVAAFSHFGTMRAALETVLGAPWVKGRVLCDNCCIAVFAFEDGVWKLKTWNL
jgi:broad specificity phosphatase PhoE